MFTAPGTPRGFPFGEPSVFRQKKQRVETLRDVVALLHEDIVRFYNEAVSGKDIFDPVVIVDYYPLLSIAPRIASRLEALGYYSEISSCRRTRKHLSRLGLNAKGVPVMVVTHVIRNREVQRRISLFVDPLDN
jgi:hypothetical protein